jgi:valyl-tRNA synthetase
MIELDPVYDPKKYESKCWNAWMKGGYFHAPVDKSKKPFTILMPPPNVTSQLHMGHGTSYTVQDILVRWRRMQGFNALWLPGTDHAGIATQMMVEKAIQSEEGKTRQEIGREAFERRLWAWKEKYGGMITEQFRRMGFSCDWQRECFTMDPTLSKAVRAIFVDLFRAGLIYRGERLVNWDPVLKTAISDDELEMKEVTGALYHIKYPLVDDPETTITVATTRPETMLGDTAVAVHPDDERYKHLIGKKLKLPLVGREIPVIADDYVKSEFGTGAVKITPAHDPNDFEIGKRHKLPFINIMNPDATMADSVPERFQGLDRFVARKEVIKALKELNLHEKDESTRHAVPHSERSKAVIEPRLSLQWFVRMKELAGPAIEVAQTGKLKFYPDAWKKTYLHWLENIQDWCISRQLWWGHRIPIWYCADCNGITTGLEDPTKCEQCGSAKINQDEDVLDTWFSSWLWPISPFGWPAETDDLKYFYPTDVLVTASEIIFLWVARMVMVGLKTRGDVPFRDVYIAATVCDKQGRKFSKTLGNGIDPLEVIDKHGTDAIRWTGTALAPLGGRIRMEVGDFESGARFVNKIWNASRFLLKYVDPHRPLKKLVAAELTLPEKWLLEELASASEHINKCLELYRINEAVERLYHLIWGSFCDWGLEVAKESLNSHDENAKEQTISVLVYVLEGILRLASPVMPFVTEEIWSHLPSHPQWERGPSLVVSKYPDSARLMRFQDAASDWASFQELVTGIRSIRSQAGLPPKDLLEAHVVSQSPKMEALFRKETGLVKRLAGLKELHVAANTPGRRGPALVHVGKGFETYIPAEGIMDVAKEVKRLAGEAVRVEKIVDGLKSKLGNENFVSRAPEEILATTRAQLENMSAQLASLRKNLASLQG